MIIEHNIGRFVVFGEDPLLAALQKISANKSGFVSVVSEQGLLLGMLTDGDIRRWLTEADGIDLDVAASSVANAQMTALPVDAAPEDIAARFSDKVRAIPLVDAYGRLTAIALPGRKEVTIGDRLIGAEHPTFIIAEIGNNHNGDPELARRLIDLAADAGADCAKFQMRDVKSLYRGGGRADDATQDLGAQYTLDLLSRFNLAPDILFDLFDLFDHSRSRGMEPMCTPWDEVSLGLLEDYGMRAYKVASADITNHDLLGAMARTGKPLICSTGMRRRYDAAIHKDISGLSVESEIELFLSPITTMTLGARRMFRDSNIAGSSGFVATGASLRIDHELFRYALLYVSADYERDRYRGIDSSARIMRVSGGGRYHFNRRLALRAELSHGQRHSRGVPNGPYFSETRGLLSLTLQR